MKKNDLIILIILTVIGSIITFYGVNLLMSDLSNMFYGVHDAYVLGSIPLFMITLDITLSIFYLIRKNKNPEFNNSIIRLYSIYGIVNSSLGLITSILAGTIIYHSFFIDSPFAGYLFIMLLVHIILLALFIYLLTKIKKDNKRKLSIVYIIYSTLAGLALYYSLNKFGAVLLSPLFISYRTLNITWPLYVSLLIPMAFAVYTCLCLFKILKTKKHKLIVLSSILFVGLLSCILTIINGLAHTEFISAVSPVLPLERLGTTPYNSVFLPIALLVFGLINLYFILRGKNND